MGGYAACLELASNHKGFERWMAQREADRLQRIAAAHAAGEDLGEVRTPQLEAVQAAGIGSLEGAHRFFYSINHEELRVEFADGQLLPFTSLSDGQRSVVTLAADLAWRGAQLNPQLGSGAPLETRGVVLIDEIELHLHPQWQRTVVDNLTRTFPRLQFVLTTHSPQVVSTARPEWLRVLRADGHWSQVDHTWGRDSNALLRDVFGVAERLPDIEARVRRIEGLLADGDVEGARAALGCLEQLVGTDDVLASGLRWELQDLEVNGLPDDGEEDAARG